MTSARDFEDRKPQLLDEINSKPKLIRFDTDGTCVGHFFQKTNALQQDFNCPWQQVQHSGKWALLNDTQQFSRNFLPGLAYEEKDDIDVHLLLQHATDASNTRFVYSGCSPAQWFLGLKLTDEIVGGRGLEWMSSNSARLLKWMHEQCFDEDCAPDAELSWKSSLDRWCTTSDDNRVNLQSRR